MELRQLEYFVAVADEANFTRAAARVNISQSGVSAQVRRLEQELGAPLIDRSGRVAGLTAAGHAALAPARAALEAARSVRQAVDDVNGVLRGRLSVGMVTGCAVTPFFDGLATFHRAHPGLEIVLVEDRSDHLVERVTSGDLDLVLAGTADPAPPELDTLVLIHEPLVALVAPGHPLLGRRRLRLADLPAHQLICLPEGTGIRTVFDRACSAGGVDPEVALQASAPAAVADLAARGLGVAILSASMAADQGDRLVALDVRDLVGRAGLALLWRRSPGPALRALLDPLRAGLVNGPAGAPAR